MKNFVLFLMVALAGSVACTADEQVPAGQQLTVGAKAPKFSLVNAVDGKQLAFAPGDGKLSVVVFTCIQCPYAKAFEPRLIEIAKLYTSKGVRFYLVNSNDETNFGGLETVANMKARAQEHGYPFPYLKDSDSSVARAYGARVTPHVYVVDGEGKLRYRGYVDDTAKAAERRVTGLTDALDALLNGREVANAETKEFGCTIKWAKSVS
jgi:thiol-disulfide isomerase/thioredoxin